MEKALNVISSITIIGLALYFFVGQADKSSQFMKAASEAYERGVGVFLK